MQSVDEIISRRKYFFSQPTLKLFEALIYREVPEIPENDRDYINLLYEDFDNANDVNRSFEFHEQITLKTITLIKESAKKFQTDRIWINCRKRCGLLRETIIWKYINRAVIVRLHDPFQVDDVNFCFRYMHFDSVNHYLDFEKSRGTAIHQNQFLYDLATEHNFDLWYINKLFNRAKLNNEQKIPQFQISK